MKKIILMSSLVFCSIAMMNAQTSNQTSTHSAAPVQMSPEARAKGKVAQISKSGTLQTEQIGKINNLFVEFYKKQDALKANQANLDAKEYEKQMTTLKTQHNNSLKAVLTPEQLKTYEAAEVNRQERMNNAAKPGN